MIFVWLKFLINSTQTSALHNSWRSRTSYITVHIFLKSLWIHKHTHTHIYHSQYFNNVRTAVTQNCSRWMRLKTLSIHRDTQIPGTLMAATRVTKYMTFKWHRIVLLPTNKSNNTYVNNSSKIFKAKMQTTQLSLYSAIFPNALSFSNKYILWFKVQCKSCGVTKVWLPER